MTDTRYWITPPDLYAQLDVDTGDPMTGPSPICAFILKGTG